MFDDIEGKGMEGLDGFSEDELGESLEELSEEINEVVDQAEKHQKTQLISTVSSMIFIRLLTREGQKTDPGVLAESSIQYAETYVEKLTDFIEERTDLTNA